MERGLFVPLVLGLLAIAALLALGTWQVRRRAWKLDLIAGVEAHLHASPVAAPGPAAWPRLGAGEAYLRVRVHGRFLAGSETLVQALTERGGGFWVMTPLAADRGFTVLVNRGFVPGDLADSARRRGGGGAPATVTGLLRPTEPNGGFLRRNDPGAGRWYARDVAAIARARRLGRVAPYFIDADATPNPGGYPVGGLTVIAFRNNHLVYAVTWYALALLTAAALVRLVRLRRGTRSAGGG